MWPITPLHPIYPPFIPPPTQGCFSRGRDRRMPLLAEVFARFPGVPISIEIKDDDDELIRQASPHLHMLRRRGVAC